MSRVSVNRSVPTVSAPPLTPVFSADPTDAELFAARIFEEPLVPMDGSPAGDENSALSRALRAYLAAGGRDAVGPLTGFLASRPSSRWRASLLTNLGIVYRRTGHLLRAMSAWEEAWTLARSVTGLQQRAVADRAIGELFELNASLGRFEKLEELFEDISGRDIRGSATEKVSGARQALWLMHNRPEESFRCGPLAIDQILRYGRSEHVIPPAVEALKSTKRGTSLAQLGTLAQAVGLNMRLAFRETGAHVPVPSVLHWKAGHFAAIVTSKEDEYLVRDPTFGGEMWVRQSTLDEEASGYFLIPNDVLPTSELVPGWRAASDGEAAAVWGRGVIAGVDPTDGGNGPNCGNNCGGGGGGISGMPVPSIHMLLISIELTDTPVGHQPTVGPAPYFQLRYAQREISQPQTFSYANLGAKWTFDWLSFVEDDPTNPAAAVSVYHRGGGKETSTSYDPNTQSYAPTIRRQAVVVRTSSSPITYERRLPDGSVEVFAQPDGALTFPRKVFLTAIKDPSGNTLSLTWDSQFRIVAATDALGQVTTVSYEDSDPLKITKVTDPFGRFARFEYDTSGRLYRITDVLGLVSTMTYGPSDIVKTLTTPYGTTTFTAGESGLVRWAELTDPLGGKQRVHYGGYVTASEPSNLVPTGMLTNNGNINHHNTLHWDTRAMAVAPGDPASATDYNWALVQSGAYQAVAVPLSIKRPIESRVWYNYHGGSSNREGTIRKPVAIGRVLDDGSSQVTKYEYNSRGHVTKQIDPLGRETIYEYATNGLDLLRIEQKNGPGYQLLEERTYNSQGLPLTVTDAAGQTTTYTYDAQGQVQTVTNAKNETTTYSYTTDRLTSVTGPVSGATTTFTYDVYGRVRTTTDADGYTVTTDYDAFDRPTRTTYPDSTYEETTYRFLDPQLRRDRLGRITRYTYDATRRLTAVQDPLGRVVTQEWCSCGSLDALVDANGHRTAWERDVQGRMTKEVRASGADTDYVYETRTSRLKTVTDPKQQLTTYTYALDDQLTGMTFTNAVIGTPSVSFTYDPVFGRLATMVDGTGTTTYGYHPITVPPTLGATQLASVDGPLPNDTITYSYDQLGRVTTRAINGAANTVTWAFDALGRVTSEANVLGTFTYTYDGPTDRVATVTYPNGQTSSYAYFGNTADHRLQTIHHRYPNSNTLSKFDYTYDAAGNILTWRQQADASAVLWEYGYDRADQLVTAVKQSTDPTPVILKRYAYAYDPAGNRLVEQIDDAVQGATYNNVNELVSQGPSGLLRFEGTVSEPATVTVGGKPALVTADNRFSASVPVVAGTNNVTITAVDGNGNTTTDTYQVTSSGASKTFTYDANGNLTTDGTRTFEWDARNQLVAATLDTHRTEFTYDGLQRRARELEIENSVVQSDTRLVWCELVICEARGADGLTAVRRSFRQGEQAAGSSRVFATDHLGSVADVTSSSASLVGRYAYDPWGRRVLTGGSNVTSDAFTRHRWHSAAALFLSLYRAYDPELGIWISEDPVGLREGPNFYRYVEGNPIRYWDPVGLAIHCTVSKLTERLVGGTCPPGAGACTSAEMFGSASACRQSSCGTWFFTGKIDMRYAITYIARKRDRGSDRNPYEVHEWLHIGDLQGWCSGLSSQFPSEGFGSLAECNAARSRFLKEIRQSFRDAKNQSDRRRDRR
jgi:RHS repeat-associated protein